MNDKRTHGDDDMTPEEIRDNFGMRHREGRATGEHLKLTPEQERARKRRNVYIALGLLGFMVVVFLVTVVRLTQNIAAGGAA
ncbi:protoheme IX farnesyltransferase [Maricaulis sp. CAU 1757]